MAGFSGAKISEAKIGLELDKMELPSISKSVRDQDSGYRGVQQKSYSAKSPRRHSIFKMMLLISGVLLPIVLLFLL